MAAKAKKAADVAEIEIQRLRDELRQSSNQEKDIQATTQENIKDLQDKLDVETSAQNQIVEAFNKQIEAHAQAEAKIQEMSEAAK